MVIGFQKKKKKCIKKLSHNYKRYYTGSLKIIQNLKLFKHSTNY